MKIVVGLGNPGKKFEKNRHNVGFLTVDYIQKNAGDFTKWQLKKKLKSEIAESKELDVILAKPQTFMNNSGEAIRNLISSFKFQVSSLYVIHDDFDLPLGTFKFEFSRGSAGHKGVQSIIDILGTKDFWRLRIGIRPPYVIPAQAGIQNSTSPDEHPNQNKSRPPIKAEDFVLKNFGKEERKIIEELTPGAIKELLG